MPRKSIPLADRFRASRESFELAMKLGCSPAQARETMRQQESERLWKESGDRLRAAANRPLTRRLTRNPHPASVVDPALTAPEAPRLWWLD